MHGHNTPFATHTHWNRNEGQRMSEIEAMRCALLGWPSSNRSTAFISTVVAAVAYDLTSETIEIEIERKMKQKLKTNSSFVFIVVKLKTIIHIICFNSVRFVLRVPHCSLNATLLVFFDVRPFHCVQRHVQFKCVIRTRKCKCVRIVLAHEMKRNVHLKTENKWVSKTSEIY